jgi:hypothetical protein
VITRLLVRDRQVDLSAAVIRLDLEGASEFANGLCILAKLHQDGAQRAMPFGDIRRELDHFFKL